MSLFLLTIYCFTILFSIATRRGKIGFYLCFLVAWLLIAGNYDNNDYGQYVLRYDAGLEVLVDIGFSILCEFFKNLGFDYQTFKGFISFICLLMIFKTIKKMSWSPSLGAAFFLIFPFIIDVTQFRNFVSYSVVFVAIPYLFENDRRSLIKYIAIILVASTIHTVSVFYLLFLLSKIKIKNMHVIIGVIAIGVAKETFKMFFANKIGTDKLDFLEKPSLIGAVFGSFVVVMNYILIRYVHGKKRYDLSSAKTMMVKFCSMNTWVYCNLMFVFIIPFLFDNGNYSRVYRNVAVLNMIFIANAYYIRKSIRLLLLTTYYAYFVISTYLSSSYFQDVLYPVFTYNTFAL